MNALLSLSSFLFPLITFPYISRILLPAGTGRVDFATSLISYFTMLAMLGVPTYGIRTCAKVRDDKIRLSRTAHELLFINLIMCVISYGLLFLALFTIPRLFEDRLLYVIVSSTILFNAIGMEWLYKALEEYTYITIRSLVFKVIAIVFMFLLIHAQKDYVLYGAISIFAASASNILNFFHAHRYIQMRPLGGYNLRRHLKPVFVFFAIVCASIIYTNLDTVMLGFMKTDVDVGYYNAAVKIKVALVALVTSLGAVLLPRVSYYLQHDMQDEFRRISRKALNFVFLMAAPFSLYFILFAKNSIYLLSGYAYTGSIEPMQIIMPTVLFIGLTGLMGIQVLVPLGKEKYVLYSEIGGAAADLILNWILIPKMGASGAAIGTLVAEAIVFVIQFIFLKAEMGEAFRKIPYLKIVIALFGGCAASVWVLFMNFGNFLSLLVSAILFFGVYYVLLLIQKETLTRELTGQTASWIRTKLLRK